MIRVLDLFSGLGGASQAFRDRGHDIRTLDLEPHFRADYMADILTWDPAELGDWKPDVVWASPPCEGFSLSSFHHHWRVTPEGDRVPKTEVVRLGQRIVQATLATIERIGPAWWWLENPRGMLRKQRFMKASPRVTVTYCQYGLPYQKPTDLWGRWPASWTPRPACRPLQPCQEAAAHGIQGVTGHEVRLMTSTRARALRAIVPYELSLEICKAVETAGTGAPTITNANAWSSP